MTHPHTEEAESAWPIRRHNAERARHTDLANALRLAWRSGDRSWIDLAGIVIGTLKPGRADADAVFTVELHPGRSLVRTQASWGGDPEAHLLRGIAALEAELADLKHCPHHASAKGQLK